MTIQITKQSDDFSTAPQISVDDVPEIAKLGFKTIINNRPDYEGGESQPTSAQLRVAAEQHGLAYLYIPVVPNNIHPAQVDAFATSFALAAKPVIGFCRTGNRAGSIFKLAQVGTANASPNTTANSLFTWLKSKCLITRFWRWYKAKCPLMALCRASCKKN
ncbi:MAG: TIGR01244 family sulfur transferase [Pseudomonadota bacterium]